MIRFTAIIVLTVLPGLLYAQGGAVSLRDCMHAAREHAILNKQHRVNAEVTAEKISMAKSGNLPSLSAYGKASYQSDAVSIGFPGGMGVELDPFQYNGGLELNQKLYDGGISRKKISLEEAGFQADSQKVEINVYQLVSNVKDYYFQLVLSKKKMEIVQLKAEVLNQRIGQLESAVKNGVVKKNELDKLKAEALQLDQQVINIEQAQLQLLATLNTLTGMSIEPGDSLSTGEDVLSLSEISRPEYQYYTLEREKLERLANLQQAKNLPKLYLYSQAGYSYPGLNFIENQSDYYYIVGAKLSWTLFDWNQNKREVAVTMKQQESISVQQQNFDQQMQIAKAREDIATEQLTKMIEIDNQIVAQRAEVAQGSAVALESGSITSGDYLEDLNAEMQARLQAEIHAIELQNAKISKQLLNGIDLNEL